MKNSVIFYQDQIEICKKYMTPEQFGRLMMALFEVDAGGEPEVDDDIRIAYEFISLQIRIDREKYEKKCQKNRENGKLGGRPRKTEKNPEKPNGYFQNPNDNDNDNDNENENDNEAKAASLSLPLSSAVISYLNDRTGSSFTPTEEDEKRVSGLIKAGYSEEDMKAVVDRKVDEWGESEKMRNYLRPRTLFGPKFADYVKAPATLQEQEAEEEQAKREKLEIDLIEAETQLTLVDEQLEEIQGKDIKENSVLYETWQDLLEHKAVLQQKIENIGKRIGG